MKLAMLGGSFNPVHRGHLALAQAVRDQLSFDRVLLVPANISPGKDSDFVADGADRMEMLRLAVENLPGIEAESCELDRGGVSWSIDTLCTLSERYSGQLTEPVAMIIGQDLTASFGRWKEAERIAREFRIIVACRPPWNAEEFSFPHSTVTNPPLKVSSSEIRYAIQHGKPWESLVPEPVKRYIEEHGLYAT